MGACSRGEKVSDDPNDLELNWWRQQIASRLPKIRVAEEPMGALFRAAYEAVDEKLQKIVGQYFGTGQLILIGGIQLNLPSPHEDHFLPLSFRATSKGGPPVNLMSEF